MSETKTPKTAADIVPGDVVQYTTQTAWRIEHVEHVGGMVIVEFTYVTCDFEPARIGTTWTHQFRASTKTKFA